MKDKNNKELKVGHLATVTATIKSIDGDSVTVDLGDGHCATLNASQVTEAVETTGEMAPERPAPEPQAKIDGVRIAVEVNDSSTSGDAMR